MEIFKNEHWSIDQYTPVDGEFFLIHKQDKLFAKVFNKDDAMLIVNNVPVESSNNTSNYTPAVFAERIMSEQGVLWHNPEDVHPRLLPEGRRFLTKLEHLKLKEKLNNNEDYKNVIIWYYLTEGHWYNPILGCSGAKIDITYCVPLDFDVTKL